MRQVRRLVLFAKELGVLFLGFILSAALGTLFDVIGFDPLFAFLPALLLTIMLFFLLRRKNRPWKVEYDAAGWTLSQAERKLHPTRGKCQRVIQRALLWVPTGITAFVLFFFPVSTHLLHPRSRYLKHFYVPIPWTATVFSFGDPTVIAFVNIGNAGRFGVTPFRGVEQLFSLMSFGGLDDALTFVPGGAIRLSEREFRNGNIALTCRHYLPPLGRRGRDIPPYQLSGDWIVNCQTPVNLGELNFYASFRGREEDIASFYKIIEGVTPIR